jgi:5S rRNA maturation endonuclease (ribonuclease M5)
MIRDDLLKAFPLGEWLQRRGVKLSNGGKRAHRCPIKEHSRVDAVSVDAAKQVWHCHACKKGGTVVDWLALEKGIEPSEALKELAAEAESRLKAAPTLADSKAKPSSIGGHDQSPSAGNVDASKPRIVKTYDYTDENGTVLFQCVRFEPKTFRQRRPDPQGKDGWTWNLQGVRLVLYRLPEVLKPEEVWIVEGEKDAESMAALGFCATCNPMGAGKWRDTYNDALRGKRVVIVPDNDEPGRRHAEAVARALVGIAASVKVLALPESVGGVAVKDGTEYINTFQDSAEAAERLAQMAESAAEWQPPAVELPTTATPTTMPVVKPLIQFYKPSEIKAYEIPPETYILGKFIMRGDVVALAGTPGVGKSRAITWLAYCGATGEAWFGLKPSRRFKTLIIQGENGLARLKDEYQLLDCALMDDWIRVSDVPAFGICVESQEFIAQLLAVILEFQPDLIVIDPFNHIVSDEKFKEFRETIRAIQDIVAQSETRAAVMFVHHLKKVGNNQKQPTGQALLDYLAGSYSFGAAMRTVAALQFASNLPEDKRRVFTICKANNEERPPATAWGREGAGAWWTADGNFDIAAFLHGDTEGRDRKGVTKEHMEELFENGKRRIARKQAVEQLMELADVKHTAAYDALKTGQGRKFKTLKEDRDGLLVWDTEESEE